MTDGDADSRQQEGLAEEPDHHGAGEDNDAAEVSDGQREAEPEHDDAERDGHDDGVQG